MSENSAKISPVSEENTAITDTGAAKIEILPKNVQESPDNQDTSCTIQANSEENSVFLNNNQQNSPIVEQNQAEDKLFSQESISAFKNAQPMVDVEGLKNNKDFRFFLSALTNSPDLSTAYSNFAKLISSIEENVGKKLAQKLANNASSVGSLASSSPVGDVFFTKEQVKAMSSEQIRKNYQKIRESQSKW